MKRYSPVLIFLLLIGCFVNAQNKYEREFRIRKSQFPPAAIGLIKDRLEDSKRIKYYKETDSTKISYEAKFKKDRLWYSIEFDKEGTLEDVEILIKEVDIPSEPMQEIRKYLDKSFRKYRIKRIQQQYPVSKKETKEKTISNAFQNLILPGINYEFVVAGKKDKEYFDYELLFGSDGSFKKMRKSLPPNYDHVLY
ncbi:hypothetical protein DZC72_07250 [Maribacter algicola]|uniref:Uncharacterized protein n=1 Tax=Maribacter algicola TaxID=2498892 RepID=A0A3R8Q5S3_9FLAO|nr:hypothetical protein [Maribacter algicola]RRQ50340.1 hypothetical protein DZC72_07250 [Maribacter algicola]